MDQKESLKKRIKEEVIELNKLEGRESNNPRYGLLDIEDLPIWGGRRAAKDILGEVLFEDIHAETSRKLAKRAIQTNIKEQIKSLSKITGKKYHLSLELCDTRRGADVVPIKADCHIVYLK